MANFAISLGISLGLQLFSALITPPTQGPRLKSRKVPRSDYGSDIPRIRGVMPLQGEIIWSPKEYREEKKKRGKIGGKSIEYVYYGDFAYAFNAGNIVGINRLKLNGESKINLLSKKTKVLSESNDFLSRYLTLYTGGDSQLPNPTIQGVDGAANTPAYRGIAYAFLRDYPLTDTGNRPPSAEAIAYTSGSLVTQTITIGNRKPIAWATLNGATLTTAPDDPLLGRISFASGSNKGAHSSDSITDGGGVEFVVSGQGTYGLVTTVPSGSYSSVFAYKFALNASGILSVSVGNNVMHTAVGDFSAGARCEIKLGERGSNTEFRINGTLVHSTLSAVATYYPVALITNGTAGGIITSGETATITRVQPTEVNLRALLIEIAAIGGVTSVDVTDIPATAQVLGIELNAGGDPKSWIQQLQQIYFFDCFQRGNTLVFRSPVKGAVVRALTETDLAAIELDSSRPPQFEYESPNPSELPGEVSLKFFDGLHPDLKTKTVYNRAETNPSREKILLSVDAALTTAQAQAIADVTLNLKWAQKLVKFKLTIAHCDLEPGDIVTIPMYGVQKRAMLTKMTLGANLLFDCEAVTQDDELFSRVEQSPTFGGLYQDYLSAYDQTYLAALKIPKIRESDPTTVLYFGVGGGDKSWNTAFLNASPDGLNWETIAQTNVESTIGVTNSILDAPTATGLPPTVQPGLDTVNTVIVRCYSGTLQTISTDAFNAGGLTNLLLIGAEILRFRDGTLIGESTYRLSYLDRGRNTTPMTGHALNERVVLLSTTQAIALEPDQTGAYQLKLTYDQQTLDQSVSIPVSL
jgi:Putative phage tail protein